jgi:hypothetical protein
MNVGRMEMEFVKYTDADMDMALHGHESLHERVHGSFSLELFAT